MGNRLPADSPDTAWTPAQYDDVLRLVKLHVPNLLALDKALAAPDPQVPTADSPNFRLAYLRDVRDLACLLAVSAHCKAGTGDYEGSLRDMERILGMGELICRGGSLTGHLVGVMCDAIAADTAWQICTRYELPVPVLRRLATCFLHHSETVEPYVEAVRAEALIAAAAATLAYEKATLDISVLPPPPNRWQKRIFLALRLLGSNRHATLRHLEWCYQHVAAIAEQPYSAATAAQYEAFFTMLPETGPDFIVRVLHARDPVGFVLASMVLSATKDAPHRIAKRDACLRGLALFAAVKAYEREQRQLPEHLDALVPRYLARVPEDAFTGKPFGYLRNRVPGLPAQAWAVYSIGDDFVDDGGKAVIVGYRSTGPDIVWPSQAYPKREAAPGN